MTNTLQPAIGILGGTFDPIHLGHLGIAKEIHQSFNLSKIKLIPCNQPVHRGAPLADTKHRVEMLKLAALDSTYLEVDEREIIRQGPSYTLDTLKDLRNEYPDTPLCLILGMDAFQGFTSWHQHMEILELAHLIVAFRPHFTIPETGEIVDLLKRYQRSNPMFIKENLTGGIFLQKTTAIDIAASEIRNCIRNNNNLDSLLPEQVYNYIIQHNLYTN